MPDMISLRTFTLSTLHGHTVAFTANTPQFVPDAAVAAAMAAGCVPVDKDDAATFEDNRNIKAAFHGDLRRSVLLLACKVLAEENDSKKFNGGYPTRAAFSEVTGFDAGRAEIRDAWNAYIEAKNSGHPLETHAEAHNVLRVVEAKSKPELDALAMEPEFGVEADKVKGFTARELRSFLLAKLSGTVPG